MTAVFVGLLAVGLIVTLAVLVFLRPQEPQNVVTKPTRSIEVVSPEPKPTKTQTEYPVTIGQMKPGDCANQVHRRLKSIPCSEPHDVQVAAVVPYANASDVYPGEEEAANLGDSGCSSADIVLDQSKIDSETTRTLTWMTYYPAKNTWSNPKNRVSLCAIIDKHNRKLTRDYR